MKKSFVSILFFSLALLLLGRALGGIETSKHNLSVTGTGDIRAVSETQICVFCHIPHNASPSAPLWNREDPGLNYIPYTSSTTDAMPGQPTGDSLLCLSCHDGTIALGDLLSRDVDVAMTLGVTTMPADRRSNLGTDLSDDHPVSFDYADAYGLDSQLVSPALLTEAVKLDRYGQLQCTSCHDPHDDTNSNFMVMDAANGALCETCHTIFHSATPHRNSTATWDGTGTDPWPNTDWTTVQENACFNCHTPHAAAGRERLLKYVNEEDNCLVCHNGHVAESDLDTALQKISVHPLDLTTGEHDPTETVLVSNRHVECQDCHNGHAVLPDAGDDDPSGTLTDVAGIDIFGSEIDPITNEYQLCFRCHGDTQDQAVVYTNRLVPEPNVRLDFDTVSNPSYHPVAGTGLNSNVPSLISPLTETSIIKCTDCHNNDDLDSTARGPHGSDFIPILERQYITLDGTAESSTVYALCYKCHDRDSILGNESFSRHQKHISGIRSGGGGSLDTPCNVCHDPHGVLPNGGIGGTHSGTQLINFDMDVVQTNSSGLLYHESTGDFAGACYLSCHGKNHNPCSYTSTGASCGGGQ
ncbi:MAG: cytochrome c3 family protein [Pseudomonadota bacterium]